MIWQSSPPVPLCDRPQREERTPSTDTPELSRLRSALAAIPNEGTQEQSYDNWFRIVCAVHHATAGSAEGLDLVHEFSARSTKHNCEFLSERCWPYVRSERAGDVVTERSLFAAAAEHGWTDPLIADDFDVVEVDSSVSRETKASTSERFEFVPAAEFMAGEPLPWIIKGVLPRAELIVIYGESQSGKTFFALDMAGAIARGEPWREHRVEQLKVGYIAAEGAGGFRNRLKAYESERGSVANIVVLADAPNFMEAKDVVDLGHAMRRAGVQFVVVDTLAQVTPGANENAGEDMGRVIGHCRTLHTVTGATIALIHHSGKDASKGARGWSGLRAAADAEIEITRCEHDRVASVTKLKDGEDGTEFGFKLLVVPVSMDSDGDVVSSCVVEHGDAGATKARQKRMPAGLPQKLVDTAVRELVALDGTAPMLDEVLDAVVLQLPFDAGSGQRDQRRKDARRALDTLLEKGWVRCEGGRYRQATNDELA